MPDYDDPPDDPGNPTNADGQMHDQAWLHLSAEARASYVNEEIAAGRWLGVCRDPLDEDVLVVMAMVAAVREDRTCDLAVLLRNSQHGRLLCTAIKLLAEAFNDEGVGDAFGRTWATWAAARD